MAKVIDEYLLRRVSGVTEHWVTTLDPETGTAVSECRSGFIANAVTRNFTGTQAWTEIETSGGRIVRLPGVVLEGHDN